MDVSATLDLCDGSAMTIDNEASEIKIFIFVVVRLVGRIWSDGVPN